MTQAQTQQEFPPELISELKKIIAKSKESKKRSVSQDETERGASLWHLCDNCNNAQFAQSDDLYSLEQTCSERKRREFDKTGRAVCQKWRRRLARKENENE